MPVLVVALDDDSKNTTLCHQKGIRMKLCIISWLTGCLGWVVNKEMLITDRSYWYEVKFSIKPITNDYVINMPTMQF